MEETKSETTTTTSTTTNTTNQIQTQTPDFFAREQHLKYIASLAGEKKNDFEFWVTEHLRMSGVYWTLGALDILDAIPFVEPQKAKIIEWLFNCYDSTSGGFGGNVGHDGHIIYTLSAIQILVMLDSFTLLHEKNLHQSIVSFISSLQKPDGSFAGDRWGEIDTRFSYVAINSLLLLGSIESINLDAAVKFILACKNFDGSFGCIPGAESHAGQTFCCVAALALAGKLNSIDCDLLGWWLAERQVEAGGLNGRPEKLPDVCYSWWVQSSLCLVKKMKWINQAKLKDWILKCQDCEKGGISDRPDCTADIFHTFFGIGGLSLLGFVEGNGKGLVVIDPAFALTEKTLARHEKNMGGKFKYSNTLERGYEYQIGDVSKK